MSATASTGETASSTKYSIDVSERRVKSAAVRGSSRASVAAAAGRVLLDPSAASRRLPPPRSGYHAREVVGSRPRPSDAPLSMGLNQDLGGEGSTAVSYANARAPDTTSEPGMAMAGVRSDSGGCEDVKLDVPEGTGKELAAISDGIVAATAAAAAAANSGGEMTNLHPCPLSGILDMSEPPLRNHRRSYYNEDDGKVYKVRSASNESTIAADIEEAPREEERLKCTVDFKGKVKHGEGCILRGVSNNSPPTSSRNSMTQQKLPASDGATLLDMDSGQEPPPLSVHIPVSVGIPVRTWHKDDKSDWDPAGMGATGERAVSSISERN